MADWRGRGGGRLPSHPPTVEGRGGRGHGGGRAGSQPTISSRGSWVGGGGGRKAGQPTLGAAMAGAVPSPQAMALKLASMAAFELRSYIDGALDGWVGRGKGRAGSQPKVLPPSSLAGTRSTASTAQMTNQVPTALGTLDKHVADPQGSFIFCLEIDGIEVAQFLECSGLKSSTTIYELEEGGMNHRVHKLPGQSKWDNLQLRYGVTGDVSLLGWRGDVIQDNFGQDMRKNGAIVVKNNQMEVVRRYNFQDAWPVSWEGPAFNANSNELAIESIELAHNGIQVTAVK